MSFADSFWTNDFESGLTVLFDKLYQGCTENDEFINLFTARMESELVYGTSLESILFKNKLNPQGFGKNDDGDSSIKTAYVKVNEQFNKEGESHLQVANSIRVMVLEPFTKWSKEHKQRIEYTEGVLFSKLKSFLKNRADLEKLQKRYFNKCRMLEEFKSNFNEDELTGQMTELELAEKENGKDTESIGTSNSDMKDETDSSTEKSTDVTYMFNGTEYDTNSIKEILKSLITSIPINDHKVAILGTYQNVSTGSAIAQWLISNLDFTIEKAESFGQDLIKNGFLRLIGSVGSNFINSSQFFYQWKPSTFEICQISTDLQNLSSINRSPSILLKQNNLSNYLEEMKMAIGVNSIDYTDRSSLKKLINEVNELDAMYFKAVTSIDQIRCEFEELVMDHLSFMQKCEFDRLKAVKKVMLDFLSAISNKIASLKSIVDELMVFEETINPINDLKFLIDNYQTGHFKPQVILYDNYYNSTEKQIFGVDLEIKSRMDKKVVPHIISCTLSYLDNVYPELANDEERISLWTKPIHLKQIHELRFKLNNLSTQESILKSLSEHEPVVITNVLKLYLLELPDSLISNNYYDLIKTLYLNYFNDELLDKRINGLQNTLSELPKANIATLDAILTHLTRLVSIIGSKNESEAQSLQNRLSKEFANLILRPKVLHNGKLTLNDKHQYKFMNDLLIYKDVIFKELRRRSSKKGVVKSASTKSDPRKLEDKLKEAVKKGKKIKPDESVSVSRTNSSGAAPPTPASPAASTSNLSSTAKPESSASMSSASLTPPPTATTTSAPVELKRSNSPSKKLSSRSNIVSSKPKKDILFDSENEPPRIVGVTRRSSVKDLASKFDTQSRSSSPLKNSSESLRREDEVIVVD